VAGEGIVHTLSLPPPPKQGFVGDLLKPIDFPLGGEAFNAEKPVVAVRGDLLFCKIDLKGSIWSHLVSSDPLRPKKRAHPFGGCAPGQSFNPFGYKLGLQRTSRPTKRGSVRVPCLGVQWVDRCRYSITPISSKTFCTNSVAAMVSSGEVQVPRTSNRPYDGIVEMPKLLRSASRQRTWPTRPPRRPVPFRANQPHVVQAGRRGLARSPRVPWRARAVPAESARRLRPMRLEVRSPANLKADRTRFSQSARRRRTANG